MQQLNDMGRRRLGGRRWGDNRVTRWGTEALLLAFAIGLLIGVGASGVWVY